MRVVRTIAGTVGAVVAAYVALGGLLGLFLGRAPEGQHQPPDGLGGFRQLLPRDAIRPVYQPQFVPASRARLDPDELVIGVELGGEARAYPVGYLNLREIVNDRIGPVPFLVTW